MKEKCPGKKGLRAAGDWRRKSVKGWRADEISEEGEDDEVERFFSKTGRGLTRRWKERGEARMIKIKLATKMRAFRVSVTDKSVGRKWGSESKHQITLCCDRGVWFATRPH